MEFDFILLVFFLPGVPPVLYTNNIYSVLLLRVKFFVLKKREEIITLNWCEIKYLWRYSKGNAFTVIESIAKALISTLSGDFNAGNRSGDLNAPRRQKTRTLHLVSRSDLDRSRSIKGEHQRHDRDSNRLPVADPGLIHASLGVRSDMIYLRGSRGIGEQWAANVPIYPRSPRYPLSNHRRHVQKVHNRPTIVRICTCICVRRARTLENTRCMPQYAMHKLH